MNWSGRADFPSTGGTVTDCYRRRVFQIQCLRYRPRTAAVARKYHGVLVFTMRPAGESCEGSDYILLPSQGTLARAILRFWSGAITGLDGAGRKVFAADLANFLIAICCGRAG